MNDMTQPSALTSALTSAAPRTTPKPVVLVPACNRLLGEHPFQVAGKKYLDAVRLAGAQPLIVPSAEPEDIDALLDLADGVLLTGSASNVHPSHFGEDVHDPSLPLDPVRDSWTLPLIRRVIDRGIPLFAICRGTQETNVALGGSLHQAVHEIDGHADHRAPGDAPAATQYGPAHAVQVTAGGLLEKVVGRQTFEVNSVHGQAVNQLAGGLRVEARAPDGVIEAFSVAESAGFSLCVQWHPEWQAGGNPVSMAMLGAFGEACRRYRQHAREPQRGHPP
jgi:putative glutamine amidotransferase